MPHNDGCPRCLCRDNEPRSWDETTGKATYRCMCGHAWSTWWEHSGSEAGLASLADLTDSFLASLSNANKTEGNPR